MKLQIRTNKHLIGYIYKITSLKTGYCYIGSTQDWSGRIKYHLDKLKAKEHINRGLQALYNRYGEKDLVFKLIGCVELENYRELQAMEYRAIQSIFYLIRLNVSNPLYETERPIKSHYSIGIS